MNVSSLQETLNKGLNIVGRAVATRTTLPITQNVLIQTDQSMLKLSATNLEVAISTWVGGKVEEEGAITVPARLLSEFVNSLPGDRIDMAVTTSPYALNLKCGRYEARIIGTDPDEFPPMPTVQGDVTVLLEPQALRTALSEVVFAAATEDSRPVLTGVKVELEEDRFTFVAADGFRLAVHKGKLAESVAEPTQVIIPAKTLSELLRLLSDQDEAVQLQLDPGRGQILFRLKNVEMISQLIQGAFPNYSQLIPETYTSRANLGVQEFLRAARTASIFARDGSGIIRIHMLPGSPGVMRVVARAEEVGENAAELDAQVDGDEAKVAFSSKYLLDVLGVTSEEQVALEVTTPSSPGVFRPLGSESYIHVVMPMFVQW